MITVGAVNGWEAVAITNRFIEATFLPGKGGDIYSLTDRESGLDVLLKSPRGLTAPRPPERETNGAVQRNFLENYEGGWQTLFPNAGNECSYRGQRIPAHGEVALRPWQWEPLRAGQGIAMRVRCETVPLELTRVAMVVAERGILDICDTITNHDSDPCHFVLGHHLVLGAPFLQPGARLEVAAERVVTSDEYWEDTARIAAGATSEWPFAPGRNGGRIDLRLVEGPACGSHDDVFATNLHQGSAEISNPQRGLTVRLNWDREIFRWVTLWQVFGGAHVEPLAGTYALGVEPWTSRTCLSDAVAEGTALQLDGGASVHAKIKVAFAHHAARGGPVEAR